MKLYTIFAIIAITLTGCKGNTNTNTAYGTNTGTVYGNSQYIKQKTRTTKKEKQAIPIIEDEIFRLNSRARSFMGGGESRVTRFVKLPPNIKECYYVVVATRERDEIEPINLAFNLGRIGFDFGKIETPRGGAYCDIYLMDKYNGERFEQGDDIDELQYERSASRVNIKEGKSKIPVGEQTEWFICFRNRRRLHYIEIHLEVVAIIEKEVEVWE